MSADDPAILEDQGGRASLRFERLLPHDRERVWRALTSAPELAGWHPTPFEIEGREGGAIRYRTDLGGPAMAQGTVTEWDPPRSLAYSWGEDELRFELAARPDGCLLVLTHTFGDRLKAARDAAGWHLCLRVLASVLDDVRPASREDATSIPEGWKQLNADYERRFGIDPARATPPPAELTDPT